MKRFIGLIILAVCFMFLLPQVSEARVRYLMPPPPPIVFVTPPDMIELPGGVYVNPDGNEEIFFSNGYYWRPYQGRWYRSYRYDGGWDYLWWCPRLVWWCEGLETQLQQSHMGWKVLESQPNTT